MRKKLKKMNFLYQILENPLQPSCRKIISVLQMYADTGFGAPDAFVQLNPMFADQRLQNGYKILQVGSSQLAWLDFKGNQGIK